ncbi:uncharacterized protein TNCV_1188861 [Trichonephila clavipes]|nr:uncharacterized protein TNCV_1188861 [Trichonephila clavipes]
MLINAHLSNLLNLTPVRNPTDIVGLRNLYDRAETQIRSLESLGVKGESYSNLLTPILLKQIPSELVLEFNRSQKDEGFDLSALLQFLHLEIRSRERASQINSHKLCHYSPPSQNRTKNKRLLFPRTTHEATPNRVHFRPHSFPTPLEKVELRSRKCLYCNKGHELDTCRSFDAHEKREILRKKGCFFLCLSPGHRAMECVTGESCPICNGSHHFSICFRNRHDDDLSPKRDTDNVISTEVNSVLLQTCAALIDVKNEQEVVRLFLDNGSQRSFVLKSTSEKFNFPILRKENLSICTFGAKETETKTLNIVKIKLKNRDDPNLCIEIEAVETEHISITNLPTPDRNIDKKFRYLKKCTISRCL